MKIREAEHSKLRSFVEDMNVKPKIIYFFCFSIFILGALNYCIRENIYYPVSIVLMAIIGIPLFFLCFFIKNKIKTSEKMFIFYSGLYSLAFAFSVGYNSYAMITDYMGKHFLFLCIYLFLTGFMVLLALLLAKRRIMADSSVSNRKIPVITNVFIGLGILIGSQMRSFFSESANFYIIVIVTGMLCLTMGFSGTFLLVRYYCCCIYRKR